MSLVDTQQIELDNVIYMVPPKEESHQEQFSRIEDLYKVGYRVAYRLLGNREAAEDVAIESVSRIIEKNLDTQIYSAGYVAKTASRLVISSWRRDAVARKYAPLVITDESTFENEYARSDLRLDLRRALTKLPKRQREMVVLRYLADLSEADVAETLDCALGTVKSTTHEALGRLKNMVEVRP